jgi:isoleucyl-tRNA synthetase
VARETDEAVLDRMSTTRSIVALGLASRAEKKIKVRQPLSELIVYTLSELSAEYISIIRDEVNVKGVRLERKDTNGELARVTSVRLDETLTPELKAEGMARDVVRHVQAARKAEGLAVDDQIVLTLETDASELAAAINTHAELIRAETLAGELRASGASDQAPVLVDGAELFIAVKKV